MNIQIIIVTYNALHWIECCLKSIDFTKFSVIVVDNNSQDGTCDYLENNFPDVFISKQHKNLGFGQANNIGIRLALERRAEYVFLLNQDAYLIKDVICQLVKFQKAHPKYGVLSPIHVTGNRKKLDKNFSNFMLKEKTEQFYSDFVLGNKIAPVYNVPFVNAAAWLISKNCLETVGGFDPLFFHYGEDDNYCQRVIYHGFKIGVLPNIYIVHDREDRVQLKPKLFSENYYKNIEKYCKITHADINSENRLFLRIRKLRKTILKLKLKLNFTRAASFQKELNILLKIQNEIEKSRAINTAMGAHYL